MIISGLLLTTYMPPAVIGFTGSVTKRNGNIACHTRTKVIVYIQYLLGTGKHRKRLKELYDKAKCPNHTCGELVVSYQSTTS